MRKPGTSGAIQGVLAALCWLALGGAGLGPWVASAARAAGDNPSAGHDAGTWDLTFEKGNRRCRLFLRAEAHGDGYALAMPAGCRKAFPPLTEATAWSPAPDEHVLLKTDAGATLFDFAPHGAGSLATTAGTSDDYELTPINPALQDILRAAAPLAAPPPALETAATGGVLIEAGPGKDKGALQKMPPSAPLLPPTSVAEVAGHYAVVRQDRDTGCMVTLETAGAAKSDLKARLAPACRDQGIVIFDPIGWQLMHGSQLVLTAKKGHTTALTRRDDKTWSNAPPRGAALVLKRL